MPPECFWDINRATCEPVGVAHIIRCERTTETEAGTEGTIFTAFCGEEQFSRWYPQYSPTEPCQGTKNKVLLAGGRLCPQCLQEKEKQDDVKWREEKCNLTPEEAGFEEKGDMRYSQGRCRRCGSSRVENSYFRVGFQREEEHDLKCQDCGFAETLGVEYG